MTVEGSVVIRKANADDNVLLAALGAETFRDAFGPHNTEEDMEAYLTGSFSPEIQAAEITDPATTFLIAEVRNEPVGFVRLRLGTPAIPIPAAKPIEIVRLYARSPWIGRGIGSALMGAALREAQRQAADVIWLDVWEENDRAIAFYRRWGFIEFGTQPFQLGSDLQNDLLMLRPLDSGESAG